MFLACYNGFVANELLKKFNDEIQEKLLQKKAEVVKAREVVGYLPLSEYFVSQLKKKIIDAVSGLPYIGEAELQFIDREKFGGDVAIKIPRLLKEGGNARYIKEVAPILVEGVRKIIGQNNDVVEVSPVGIYINVLLGDRYLFENVLQTIKLGEQFGQSDSFRGKSVVVDYSSPNVAKHLHAGHIRSTIIGEVLCNLYQSVGYTVHRLNYINDWGGTGFLIEGYLRWAEKISKARSLAEESKNSLLYSIYKLYRRGEKLAQSEFEFNKLEPSESIELAHYYGAFGSFVQFQECFTAFKNSADERFKNLETGNKSEFDLWQKIRGWSMEEFDVFYALVSIEHDYVLGESFYAKLAEELVADKLSTGEIVLFTKDLADCEVDYLETQMDVGTLTKEVFVRLRAEVENDVGAYVVLLSGHKRLLVKKSNGGTLYATRDLAGVGHRVKTFDSAKLVYEVGEEQTEYFKNLFEASRLLNLGGGRDVSLSHVSHGLYVDAETKKKLSSRDGAEGVENIILESIKYFRAKYEIRDETLHELSLDDKDKNARKLAVGSIVFNDIKQARRYPVALHRDLLSNIKSFEESGGAYIMYSLARARSIVRKSAIRPENLIMEVEDLSDLTEDEIEIIKRIAEFPIVICRAADEDSPSVLAEFLLNLADDYNSYYEKERVLEGGKLLYPHRLLITAAVAQVLANGLKTCHAEAPEII